MLLCRALEKKHRSGQPPRTASVLSMRSRRRNSDRAHGELGLYCGQRLLSAASWCLPAPGGQNPALICAQRARLGIWCCTGKSRFDQRSPASLRGHCIGCRTAGVDCGRVDTSSFGNRCRPADHFQLLSKCRPIMCAAPSTSRLAQL